MTDRNNVDVVKTEVVQLDRLSQQFHDVHNLYLDALISPEEKENASRHFIGKENDIFEYRKEVVNWILECEAKISDQLDGLSQVDKQSRRSRSSRTSHSSISVQSARMKEKAKVAELTAERSMLNEKLKLQAAEEQLQLDLQIAKTQAKEQAFAELEEELKLPARDEECHDSFFALPRPASDCKHELPPSFVNAPLRLAGVKPELERKEREPQPLNPAAPEFRYRAFSSEIKREIKEETPNVQKSDEKLLKEVFKIQQSQIENMISSQQQLATAVTLLQPEVPKFSRDPMKYKTFIMAFDARIQSRVPSEADRLYYLDQHLIGEPKDLIGGCLHIQPDEGYPEARKLLEKEYGEPYKVSNAFMQKLSSWPVIKYDDGPALKRFSFFLVKCNNAMKTIAHMTVLNHPPNMQSIVQKLPNNLQTKWRENAVKSR